MAKLQNKKSYFLALLMAVLVVSAYYALASPYSSVKASSIQKWKNFDSLALPQNVNLTEFTIKVIFPYFVNKPTVFSFKDIGEPVLFKRLVQNRKRFHLNQMKFKSADEYFEFWEWLKQKGPYEIRLEGKKLSIQGENSRLARLGSRGINVLNHSLLYNQNVGLVLRNDSIKYSLYLQRFKATWLRSYTIGPRGKYEDVPYSNLCQEIAKDSSPYFLWALMRSVSGGVDLSTLNELPEAQRRVAVDLIGIYIAEQFHYQYLEYPGIYPISSAFFSFFLNMWGIRSNEVPSFCATYVKGGRPIRNLLGYYDRLLTSYYRKNSPVWFAVVSRFWKGEGGLLAKMQYLMQENPKPSYLSLYLFQSFIEKVWVDRKKIKAHAGSIPYGPHYDYPGYFHSYEKFKNRNQNDLKPSLQNRSDKAH